MVGLAEEILFVQSSSVIAKRSEGLCGQDHTGGEGPEYSFEISQEAKKDARSSLSLRVVTYISLWLDHQDSKSDSHDQGANANKEEQTSPSYDIDNWLVQVRNYTFQFTNNSHQEDSSGY
jgi:hypothetical protein